MPKAESKIGTEGECEAFEQGTDPDTAGWWYHGTTQEEAEALRTGQKRFIGADEVCFTRNPKGASQDMLHGDYVIRAKVNLNREYDTYFIEAPTVGITQGFAWLKTYDASRIMIDRCYIRHEPDR